MKPFIRSILSVTLSVPALLVPAQDAPDGKALYGQYCAQCHGAELQGGNAQSMVDGIWNFGEGKGYLSRNIKHGITHLGMPAYESALEDNQIEAIVDFILTAEKESGAVKPPPPTEVQTLDYVVGVEPWVAGLEIPWSIAFPDVDTALVTERPGRLRLVKDGVLAPVPIEGTPEVLVEGQGGLLDVAVDPDYAANGWVYLAYSHGLEAADESGRVPGMTRIVRAKIRDGKWTGQEVLFEAAEESYLTGRVHFGSRIIFDAEGHLYFSIGERGVPEHAQELGRPNGKIHRIHRDGSIPADNPFVDTPGALPSIYAYGNRNPQGLAYHPESGVIWSTEHGPMGGDEVNTIRAGKNYGWPVITYGRNYNGSEVSTLTRKDGMEQPSFYWLPSIAACGLDVYTGTQFPKWEGALLAGALKYESVAVLQVDEDRVMHEEVILKNAGRVRDVAVGPDGAVYVVTNSPDAVLKLTVKGERTY